MLLPAWLLPLQMKLAALQGPQESLYSRAQQLERLLKEKQAQLSAAAKQARLEGTGGEGVREGRPASAWQPCLCLEAAG